MSLLPLLPVAASVAPSIARQAVERLTEGLSFLDNLRREEIRQAEVVDASLRPNDREAAKLAEVIRERLAAAGVDTHTPLRLKRRGADEVIVDGAHPDRVLVESLFAHDPRLRSLFDALANTASAERAAPISSAAEFRLLLGETGAELEFE